MVFRRTISLVAMLAVLLHAAVVMRHTLTMSAPKAGGEQALLADLGVICHLDTEAAAAPVSALPPGAPEHGDAAKCPTCLGLVAAFVLTNGVPQLPPPARGPPARLAALPEILFVGHGAELLPPVRGPPAA